MTNSKNTFRTKTYTTEQFEQTVARMRAYLYSLARKRSSGTVTADDVHRYLDREGVRPQQVRTRLRFINSVLRSPGFRSVGETRSNRPVARGRTISEWSIG